MIYWHKAQMKTSNNEKYIYGSTLLKKYDVFLYDVTVNTAAQC